MKKTEKATLKIVIKAQWFDLIATNQKKIEYREQAPFWESRLYDKTGKKREYDFIEFINGYNTNAPRMITEYKGFNIKDGLFNIHIGKIISKSF